MSFGSLANVRPTLAKKNQLLYTAPAGDLVEGRVSCTNQTSASIRVRVGLSTGGLDVFNTNGYVVFEEEIPSGEYFESEMVSIANGQSVIVRSTDTQSAFTFVGESSPDKQEAGIIAQGYSSDPNMSDLLHTFPAGKNFKGNLFVCNKATYDSKVRVGLGTTSTDYLEYNYEVMRKNTHVRSDITGKPNDLMYVRSNADVNITPHTISNAIYDPVVGIMTVTIAQHGFTAKDHVRFKDGAITFRCAQDDYLSDHSYPRPSDPISGKWLKIQDIHTDSFAVQVLQVNGVGAGAPQSNVTGHKFQSSLTQGLERSYGPVNFVLTGKFVEYTHFFGSVGIGSTVSACNAYVKEGLGIGITDPGDKALNVIGDTQLSKVTVTDDIHIGGNVQTIGVSTFAGTVTFQGGTVNTGVGTENAVVLDANVNSNITPGVANSFDLGQDSKKWRYVYYADTLRGNQIDLSNGTTGIATIGVGFAATTTQAIIGAANTAVMAYGDLAADGDLIIKGEVGIGTTTLSQLSYDSTIDELVFRHKSLNRNVPIWGPDTNYQVISSNTTIASWTTAMCDTDSGGTFTLTLPAAPVQGDRVKIMDYRRNFDAAALTIARNGKPIMGDAADMTVSTEGAAFELLFWDDTNGWLVTNI